MDRCTICHRASHLPGTWQGHRYAGKAEIFAGLTIQECAEFRRIMVHAMHDIRHAEPGRLDPGTVAGPLELEFHALVMESFR